jgi:AcrR family transcriptional regulator
MYSSPIFYERIKLLERTLKINYTEGKSREKNGEKMITSEPKMPLREKKKRQVEHKITHSALQLFEKKGYDAVSIDDIAETAEVSKSTFYNYFVTKEAVLIKLSMNSVNNVKDILAKAPAQDDPIEMIRLGFHCLIDDIYSWRNVAREAARISVYNKDAHDMVNNLIVNYVADAQKNGIFRSDYDCDMITRSLMGLYYIAIFGLDPKISKKECKKQLDVSLTFLLEGIERKGE